MTYSMGEYIVQIENTTAGWHWKAISSQGANLPPQSGYISPMVIVHGFAETRTLAMVERDLRDMLAEVEAQG